MQPDDLMEDLIHSLQKHVEVDEPELETVPALTTQNGGEPVSDASGEVQFDRMTEEDLLRGRLIAPFDLQIPRERAWCLVYPRNVRKQKVELFRDWIHEEARAVPDGVGGATPFNLD